MFNILVVFFSSECQKQWEHVVHNLLSIFILNVTLKGLRLKYKVWKLIKNYTNTNYTNVTRVNTLRPILNLQACILNMKHIWINWWNVLRKMLFKLVQLCSIFTVSGAVSLHFLPFSWIFFFFCLRKTQSPKFFSHWLIVTFSCSQKKSAQFCSLVLCRI